MGNTKSWKWKGRNKVDEERDRFLMNIMELKLHNDQEDYPNDEERYICVIDFSTWTNFGRLWEWSTKQHWWDCYWMKCFWSPNCIIDEIHPDTFANKIYNFLKKIN